MLFQKPPISSHERSISTHESLTSSPESLIQTHEKSVQHYENYEINIPILEITILIMMSETDFESSLSGRPNPVPFVKTLTGLLHWSAVEREKVSSAFFQLKIQNHLSIFQVFLNFIILIK